MTTQITVAVGANGEALNAQAMRDGARADRLDSEATAKQARQAVADGEVDQRFGRDNKRSKYAPSRDPAAFARGKKDEDESDPDSIAFTTKQLVGVQLYYNHRPMDAENIYDDDLPYLNISMRGIEMIEDENGVSDSILTESVEIELIRNNRIDTFNVPWPSGYEDGAATVDWYNGSAATDLSFEYWPVFEGRYGYGQTDFKDYAVTALVVNDLNIRQYWYAVTYDSRYVTLPDDRMDPIDNTSTIKYWQPDRQGSNYYSINLFVNGRTGEDDLITGWSNYRYDPVHELFMLPFTEELSFILVIFTDYNIGSTGGFLATGTVEASGSGPTYPSPGGLGAHFGPATATVTSYSRSKPDYRIPEGYEFPDFNFETCQMSGSDPYPKARITEAGANKIQQVILYKNENGTITEIDVPEPLRVAASNLSPNLANKDVPGFSYSVRSGLAGYEQSVYYMEDGFNIPINVRTTINTDGDSWQLPKVSLPIDSLDNYVIGERKYLQAQQRERSICKGYGFGKLSTENHFDTPFIESESKGFYDDKFFTPMVYQYLLDDALPSMSYARAAAAFWEDPETGKLFNVEQFVDSNGGYLVRQTKERPDRVDLASQADDLGEWVYAPQLKGSTHRCWNWNRPDLCWDKLLSLGFSKLIGTRPANPYNQE